MMSDSNYWPISSFEEVEYFTFRVFDFCRCVSIKLGLFEEIVTRSN